VEPGDGALNDPSVHSLRFPPVNVIASGMPWPSTNTWCLLPGRTRSTGLGPLLGPAERPACGWSRSPPGTSRAASPPQLRQQDDMEPVSYASLVAGGEPPPARHAGAEAELLGQVLPLGAWCPGRTASRAAPSGQEPAAARPPASDPAPAATARLATTVVRHTDASSSPHGQPNEYPSRQSHHQWLLLGHLKPDSKP
jgi:hypothetical protein